MPRKGLPAGGQTVDTLGTLRLSKIPFSTLYYLPAGLQSVTKAGIWSCLCLFDIRIVYFAFKNPAGFRLGYLFSTDVNQIGTTFRRYGFFQFNQLSNIIKFYLRPNLYRNLGFILSWFLFKFFSDQLLLSGSFGAYCLDHQNFFQWSLNSVRL